MTTRQTVNIAAYLVEIAILVYGIAVRSVPLIIIGAIYGFVCYRAIRSERRRVGRRT
jgi:hypothetical protein